MPEERVGSVGEEAFKLLRTFVTEAGPTVSDQAAPDDEHVCSTGWCPVCQVVGLVKEHPEVVGQLTDSAMVFVRSVRDVLERVTERREDPS